MVGVVELVRAGVVEVVRSGVVKCPGARAMSSNMVRLGGGL